MVILFAVLATPLHAAKTNQAAPWAGSASCAECHQPEYAAWRESHHYHAMQPATGDTVLGDFDDTHFEYGGVRSRFYRRDGKFLVETDGPDGALQEFEISHAFGVYPLQQYLVPFPDGRYQALGIAWDSRPQAEGGQRWFHLYPQPEGDADFEPVRHDDLVHWTGSYQNWNSRCAVCHSTGLEKNYSAATDRYDTTWQEINVACEACHGPAAGHLAWARAAAGDSEYPGGAEDHKGFDFSLADRGAFGPGAQPDDGKHTFRRLDGQRPTTQLETCAACHSRRSEFDHYEAGGVFNEHHRLALIEPGLYFPDGQILDEVYVWGSFLQSRMYAEGVVCSNCHDPHSNRLRAEGNALCTQCHQPQAYDTPAHHHHPAGSAGAACVECHMPDRTYMVLDDRRDHSFRVPEPRLSEALGTPNACTQCHASEDADWAVQALDDWGAGKTLRAGHAPLLAQAWAGNPAGLPGLLELAANDNEPAIVRASALAASSTFPSRETLQAVMPLLADPDPLVRSAAVRSLDWIPPEQRYGLLHSLVEDPVKAVRMAVARQLAGMSPDSLDPRRAKALAALNAEYLATLKFNADMPEEQMGLGLYYAAQGDAPGAERAYRQALKLAPAYAPALLNLADLYRSMGMDQQAKPLLQRAIAIEPDAAPPYHALGLLLVREKQLGEAVRQLETAARLEPQNPRYAYVLGVAQWENGQREQAIATLEAALATHPGHPDIQAALQSYKQQL